VTERQTAQANLQLIRAQQNPLLPPAGKKEREQSFPNTTEWLASVFQEKIRNAGRQETRKICGGSVVSWFPAFLPS
jgi:hypothetical protein